MKCKSGGVGEGKDYRWLTLLQVEGGVYGRRVGGMWL